MEHLREALNKVMGDALRRAPAAEAPLLAWPAVCGSSVAARTRAIEFARGVLRVEVPDATWRTQLSSFAPRYLASLSQILGEQVRSIEFIITPGGQGR